MKFDQLLAVNSFKRLIAVWMVLAMTVALAAQTTQRPNRIT